MVVIFVLGNALLRIASPIAIARQVQVLQMATALQALTAHQVDVRLGQTVAHSAALKQAVLLEAVHQELPQQAVVLEAVHHELPQEGVALPQQAVVLEAVHQELLLVLLVAVVLAATVAPPELVTRFSTNLCPLQTYQ